MAQKPIASEGKKGASAKKDRQRSTSGSKRKDTPFPDSSPEKQKKKFEPVFPVVQPAPSSSTTPSMSGPSTASKPKEAKNAHMTEKKKKKSTEVGTPAPLVSSSSPHGKGDDHTDGPPEAQSARQGGRGERGMEEKYEGWNALGFVAPSTHPSRTPYSRGGWTPRGRGPGVEERGRGRGNSLTPHQDHDASNAFPSARGRGRGRGSGSGVYSPSRTHTPVRAGEASSSRFHSSPRGRRAYSKKEEEEEVDRSTGEEDASSSTSAPTRPPHTHVITTVNERQSEIPLKLNTKVFIDGLPYHEEPPAPGKPTLEEELLQFAVTWRVGKPLRLLKKPGQGFGFLVFKSPHSVDTAVRVLNGRTFLGRVLRVERPKEKNGKLEGTDDPSSIASGTGALPFSSSSYQQQLQEARCTYPRQVLLTDLPKGTQPDMLREVIRDLAPLLEQKIEAIKMTSNNRKAFLTCDTEEDAGAAVKFLDGLKLLGRTVAALRAAPPGTLPYSPVHHKATPLPPPSGKGAEVGTKRGREEEEEEQAARQGAEEDDDDGVVPLGLAISGKEEGGTRKKLTRTSLSTPSNDAANMSSSNARLGQTSASRSGLSSSTTTTTTGKANVTGKTKKYNLLDDGPTEVYVGNLDEDITEAQVRQHFAPCGNIRSCELVVNPHTFAFTGIAKVNFSLPAYAAYAKEHLHGSRLGGNTIRVDRD